jgi:nitroreductase
MENRLGGLSTMMLLNKGIEPQNDLRFEERPVPQALVLELLNHAVWAPNHRLREPWRFIYIGDNHKAGWIKFYPFQSTGAFNYYDEKRERFK